MNPHSTHLSLSTPRNPVSTALCLFAAGLIFVLVTLLCYSSRAVDGDLVLPLAYGAIAVRTLAEREAILRVGDAVRRAFMKAGLKHEAAAAQMRTSPSELSKDLNERGFRFHKLDLLEGVVPGIRAMVFAELEPRPDLPARVDALESRVCELERRLA